MTEWVQFQGPVTSPLGKWVHGTQWIGRVGFRVSVKQCYVIIWSLNIELERLWKYSECGEGSYCNDICPEVSEVATVQVMKAYGAVDVYLHLFLTLVRDWCLSALRAGYFTTGERVASRVLRENTKNLSQSTRSPGLDFNRTNTKQKFEAFECVFPYCTWRSAWPCIYYYSARGIR